MDTSNLVDTVRDRSQTVIESELRRLAKRAPTLSDAELDAVDQALREIADHLLLERLRNFGDRADELAALFAMNAPSNG